jgi:DNA-binding response OmpR family regulator
MARLALIDDDTALVLVSVLSIALEDAGHEVSVASTGRAGLQLIGSTQPEVVITDVNMPELDGFSLCRSLRAAGNRVPIIVLTSRNNEVDEALGLEFGADDYVTKPFSTRVLLARVQALLRREAIKLAPPEAPAVFGELSVASERLELRWRGTVVPTTVTEFRLVEALSRRPGAVLSRDVLIDHCCGEDAVVGDRLVDTYVRRLRRKFEEVDASFDAIETVVGAGYRWRG